MGSLSYAEALEALEARGRFGVRLGLARTRALLRALGHPERSFRGALVAGTNGKGSVLALAASVLRSAGHRVGETPKPHLVSYRERLQIDGRPIEAGAFADLVARVLPAADRIASRHGVPTEFEVLTAAAYLWFAESSIDVAVVEVGLGGRLDATHAWDGGVAVVTNVDLDHMDRLGPTVPIIAREKAAIIERGDLAVTGATGEALTVVRRRARRMAVPLTEVSPAPVLGWDRDTLRVELPRLGVVDVGLRGRHQAANVAVADATLDALGRAGIAAADAGARRAGYRAARWPGRLELLQPDGCPSVLLDGAHNPAGARALAVALDDLRPLLGLLARGADPGSRGAHPPVTLMTAMMADKDAVGTVEALAQSGVVREAMIVCTQVDDPRAMPADALADVWRRVRGPAGIDSLADQDAALERCLGSGSSLLVVAGSLYLVGAVRGRLVRDPLLDDPVAA